MLWGSSLQQRKGEKKGPKEGRLQPDNLRLDVIARATTGTAYAPSPCEFRKTNHKGIYKLHSPGIR